MSDAATQAAAHKAAGNAALKEDRLDDAIAEYTKVWMQPVVNSPWSRGYMGSH